MKKKLIIIGSIVVGVIILGFLLFFLLRDDNSGSKPSQFKLKDIEKIDICKDADKCIIENTSVFANIYFDTDIQELKEAIDEMNNETKKYKEKMTTSNFNSLLCDGHDENFKYSYRILNQYYFYSNDKYISVSVGRNELNTCTLASKGIKMKPAIYDKVSNKMLTQNEFKMSLGITDEMVYKIINDNIDILNQYEINKINKKKDYDYVLFYNTLGELTISYYLDAYQNYLVAKMIV